MGENCGKNARDLSRGCRRASQAAGVDSQRFGLSTMKYLAVFLGANLLLAQSTAVPEAEPLKKPPLAAPAAAPNVKAPTSKEAAKSEPAGVPGDKRAKGEALRFT